VKACAVDGVVCAAAGQTVMSVSKSVTKSQIRRYIHTP